jgi:hypothetical protein
MNAGNDEPKKEVHAMGNDYLWDRSGEPDPEIQRLEALLGRFQLNRPRPAFTEIAPARGWWFIPRRMQWVIALAAVAAVAAVCVITVLVYERKPGRDTSAGWDVSAMEGTPRLGWRAVSEKGGKSRLGVGQTLETGPQARARLRDDEIGQIEVDPGTRLRLLNMGSGSKRIALDRGTIHTFIWAPPGQFVVDTPSAMAVDLGCAYTLHVDDTGAGLVRTSLGWVGFKLHGRESFIPAGAACLTRPNVGPGTPYFEDASSEFRSALMRFDFEDTTPEQRVADLGNVLAQARPRDALTLWHLLSRVDGPQRAQVYSSLVKFVPLPSGVSEAGILRLDQPMLDQWWNALGFDDISVWRYWERSWSGAAPQANAK